MEDDTPPLSKEALFRFSVISKVLASINLGMSRPEAIRSASQDSHVFPDGSFRLVPNRSIYRWLAAYAAGQAQGLEPKGRLKTASSDVLPQAFLDFLISEKQEDPKASVPELIRRARISGVLKNSQAVHRSTAYRACKRLGLALTRCRHAKDRDSRRFAHPHRMEMVLCDGKHFRAGVTRRKRVALFFIDDATRNVLTVVVGTDETAELFLQGLYECIYKYGLMSMFYVDNGPGFVAKDSIAVFAKLGIPLIHGEVRYKEGHGKIERFNRTVKDQLLRGLDGSPDVDPDIGALKLRLQHFIEKVYAHCPHEALDGDTPYQRFHADTRSLRFPEDDRSLRSNFEISIERRVSNDHVISLDGIVYEMPRGYAGSKVTVRRRLLDGTIVFMHKDNLIELHQVNLVSNARAKRAKNVPSPSSSDLTIPPRTAAQIAFQNEFKPVVDEDGGFIGDLTANDHQEKTS